MLPDRISALLNDLHAAQSTVSSVRIAPFIQSDARSAIIAALAREATTLRTLQRDIAGNQLSPQTSWDNFEAHRLDCEKLLRNSLAFVQGASLRALELDAGICSIADVLIAELSRHSEDWREFTLLAEEESYADLSAIIHLRFPAADIWNLSVAAHEFGHFLAGELIGRDAAGRKVQAFGVFRTEMQQDAEASSRPWSRGQDRRLEEFFADCVGTFALGPAFACTCLLLRFNPRKASISDGGEHPSDVERAFVIRRILMLLASDGAGFKGLASSLDKQWLDSLAEVAVTDVSGDRATELGRLAKKLFRLLQDSAGKLQFARWPQAQLLWSSMTHGSPEDVATDDASLVDLLNAAWIGRRQEDAKWPTDRINATVLDIARRIGTRSRQ